MNIDIIIRSLKREIEKYYGADRKRIDHALTVHETAKTINATENGNPVIVECAALLHDVGIVEAEKKYGQAAAIRYQAQEGVPVVAGIIAGCHLPDEDVDAICNIIRTHHSAGVHTPDENIVWDADWLVAISEEYDLNDSERVEVLVKRIFRTPSGRALAEERLLKRN